jgi:F-box domain
MKILGVFYFEKKRCFSKKMFLEEKINLCNLKRKINDSDDDVIPQIVRDYRKKFCLSLDNSSLEWRHGSNELQLFDKKRQKNCLIISRNNCVFIPPDGKKTKRYQSQWTPKNLPNLTNDALKCIFKFIPPWELLNLRFVCKQWNRVIVETKGFWGLNGIDSFNPKTYIHHMYLNVRSESQIIDYFFAFPDIFFDICRIVLGQDRFRGKSNKYILMFGNYKLHKKSGEIRCGSCKIKIQNFMEVYRQKICMQLPEHFQIRD